MTLEEYLSTRPHGTQMHLVRKLGITKTWMSLVVNGRKVPSLLLANAIEMLTEGLVTAKDLCPSRLKNK